MKKNILVLIALIMLLVGCTKPVDTPVADDKEATDEGISAVVLANNQFAFELYDYLNKEEKGNIFYSPYSIFAALAMTYEGAKGQTAEEMKTVFHYPDNNVLRPNFAAIYNNINKGNNKYSLSTGNALWLQKEYLFLEDYTTRISQYYGGQANNVDFVQETEETRQLINRYIEEQTNDKIKDLIPQGAVGPLTRMVLTNAIYFKGTWVWQFDKKDTRKNFDFKVEEDNIVKTDMMYMDPDKAMFNYAELEKLQILELPYEGEEVSMLILLPKQGRSYDYENDKEIVYEYTLEDIELNVEKLEEYKVAMKETKLDSIFLPKFEFDTKYSMAKTLSDMGMPTAFLDTADFSGMTEEEKLFISSVIHQAYVKVDEEGTEAAAATAVMVGTTSARPMNIFMADHPFIFIIQERETGNILFMGKVVEPEKE